MRGSIWLVPVALTLLLAACGEADEPASTADRDRPVQAPAEHPRGATPARPAECERVSRRLVGRRLGAARATAERAGCPLRVVIRDGQSLAVTEDFSPSRINVRTERGLVVEIVGLF
jgi:hypothetical protein